MLDLAIKWS